MIYPNPLLLLSLSVGLLNPSILAAPTDTPGAAAALPSSLPLSSEIQAELVPLVALKSAADPITGAVQFRVTLSPNSLRSTASRASVSHVQGVAGKGASDEITSTSVAAVVHRAWTPTEADSFVKQDALEYSLDAASRAMAAKKAFYVAPGTKKLTATNRANNMKYYAACTRFGQASTVMRAVRSTRAESNIGQWDKENINPNPLPLNPAPRLAWLQESARDKAAVLLEARNLIATQVLTRLAETEGAIEALSAFKTNMTVLQTEAMDQLSKKVMAERDDYVKVSIEADAIKASLKIVQDTCGDGRASYARSGAIRAAVNQCEMIETNKYLAIAAPELDEVVTKVLSSPEAWIGGVVRLPSPTV